ncbi:MAG: hypothetical protein NZ553_12965 [Caldilinea sp.]|nr:hypothetical protein [Caldilinea sp.]MDW8441380.1 hypothetical protein [Caldilineaceae bacterium]
MKRPVTVADILNSVEFELLQHSLMQDDVSEGIQRLRTYQARARVELFGQAKSPSFEDVVNAQFNANEMMTTLIQVMNERLEALRQEVRQAAYLKQHASSTLDSQPNWEPLSNQPLDLNEAQIYAFEFALPASTEMSDRANALKALAESIQDASTDVEIEVRQSQLPIIGGLLHRIRRALHELVLFYTNKVVRRQAQVNDAYNVVLQELVALNRAQAQEIAQLRWHLQRLTAPGAQNDQASNG